MDRVTQMKNKKIKQIMRKYEYQFLVNLLSNMSLLDRIRFVFTGNYYISLQKTEKKLKEIGLKKEK